MSKIGDPVGKSGDHIEKTTSGGNSFASVLQAKSNKKVVKIQELRNENVVEGAAVKAEVKKAPFWIKLHHVPIVAYLEIGLSLITTQLGKPIMLDSYTSSMCLSSWGKSTYARALIEVSAENELLDSLVIAMPIDKDNDLPVVNDADEGFVEVKKKKHKNKNKQHKVAGLRLPKPQPQLLYRRVERGETFQKVHTDKVPIVTQAPKLIVKNSFGPLDENEGDGFHDESLKQDDFLNVSDSEVDEEFQVDHNGNVSSNHIEMLDVQSTGLRYTWTQKPKGGHGILKKLDRIMANLEFNDVFMGLMKCLNRTVFLITLHPFFVFLRLNLKKPLSKLLYDKGNVHANVNKLRTDLDAIQTALDADPFNVVLYEREATCVIEFNEAEGETSNFNYANLFNVRLNDQEAQNMVREIFNQEVKDAIFSIGDDKSPGLDGFTAAFFKEAWNIIANDVYLAVSEFFRNGTLIKEINHTIIALLPKVKSPSRVNDYRPSVFQGSLEYYC
nr:hypothetical protein [Tanacetum cinerariifolium]